MHALSRWALSRWTLICIAQALTKAGVLNVPEWYDAGKVAIENSFAPFGEQHHGDALSLGCS